MVSVEYAPGIEDAAGVHAGFEGAHQADLVVVAAEGQKRPLHDADAVFGGDRAFQFADQAVDDLVDGAVQGVGVRADVDDDVQIAVADMAKEAEHGIGPLLSQPALDFVAEVAHVGDIHADVVGMHVADALADLGGAVAHGPKFSNLVAVVGDDDVVDQLLPAGFFEHGEEEVGVGGLVRTHALDEHVKGVAVRQRSVGVWHMGVDELVAVAPEHFEGAEVGAEPVLGVDEQVGDFIERAQAAHGHRLARRARKQLQHRPGNDAECAFAADEQLLDVVAGVVLAQFVQIVDDGAVGEHGFKAHGQLPGHAVTDHPVAAGVGRQVAADGAASPGAEIEWEEQAFGVGALLDDLQWHAGFNGHRAGVGIELHHLVHAFETERDFVFQRRGGGNEPGHSALGRYWLASLVAERENRRDFFGGSGTQQQGRPDRPVFHQVLVVLRLDIVAFAVACGSDDFLEPVEKASVGFDGLKCHGAAAVLGMRGES